MGRSANEKADAWLYVRRGKPDECWSWAGSRTKKGYGSFSCRNKEFSAHRVIFELENGPIPADLQVMHKCNNKACCNPQHLKLGTDVENQGHAAVSSPRVTNSSGLSGVHRKETGEWVARATLKRQRTILYQGYDFFEACCARKSWDAKRLKEVLA